MDNGQRRTVEKIFTTLSQDLAIKGSRKMEVILSK